jgi:eukaryotic-like serine/threonine-protein kinase
MPDSSAERNLLFGLLALQMDFITRDALITALTTWAGAKERPLGQVLQSQGALAADDDGLLDSLVCRFIRNVGPTIPRARPASFTKPR